jgi:hypothetical protein
VPTVLASVRPAGDAAAALCVIDAIRPTLIMLSDAAPCGVSPLLLLADAHCAVLCAAAVLQDIFDAGLVLGDTDYRQLSYKDRGQLPGKCACSCM